MVEVQSTPNTDEQGTEPPRGAGEEGSLDDLEFWLSESPSTTRKKAKEEKEETPVKTAPPQREQVEEEEEKGKKKGKKTKVGSISRQNCVCVEGKMTCTNSI